jgi:hypothetical protein
VFSRGDSVIQLCMMSMHPTLTLTIYALIAFVLVGVATYTILYTRGLHTRRATLDKLGRMPVTREEGIAIATDDKERAGRTGTIG